MMKNASVLTFVTAAILSGAPAAATAQGPEAVQAATAGYAELARGDIAAAAVSAARAVAAAPDNLEYRLLWADTLLRGSHPLDALGVLWPVREVQDYRVQTRIAEAATGAGRHVEAAQAFGAAARLAPDAETRSYLTRARIQALLTTGQVTLARTELRQAWSAGVLPGSAPLDAAMIAIAAGADAEAQLAFAEAEKTRPLTGRVALDAAYSARRLGRDREAVLWFRRGLNTLPASETLQPQQRFEIEREIKTLQRRGGASATLSRGAASTAAAATPGSNSTTQAGAEAYYRVGGYRNGRPVDVFARAYATLDAPAGQATGGQTAQGWVGVRWKPLSQANLVLEASRMIALGDLARNDTMLRIAASAERGGDLRYDRDSWPSWRLYGDLARIIDDRQTLAVADAQAGMTWRSGQASLLTAGIGVRGRYDSALLDRESVGVGPRLGYRRWFNAADGAAPASYIDLLLGYDFEISGDRGSGVNAQMSVSY